MLSTYLTEWIICLPMYNNMGGSPLELIAGAVWRVHNHCSVKVVIA
jgi:hypothetical protein